jgi:ssDNA-binding Zn-finger/Zn-ribbon topoisomerase 1
VSGRVTGGSCTCGGTFVLRTGRYGQFYGCSRYPRCKRTPRKPLTVGGNSVGRNVASQLGSSPKSTLIGP